MDRATVYTQEQGRSVDFLFAQRATMIGLAKLSQAAFGSSIVVHGLAVTPNSPAALNVLVGLGEIYTMVAVDATSWGALGADTTDVIMKQGLNMAAQTISTPAPSTSGYSINYLIEAQYQDQDTNSVVLPFFNSNNPQQPLNGQGGNGQPLPSQRQGVCVIQAKAGIAAPTGTQVTPSVDSGWTALAVVTVANGQSTVTSGNISVPAGVPQVTSLLQMMQTGSTTYAVDTSTTPNTITLALTPAVTSYGDGNPVCFKAANNNTGPCTINWGGGSIALNGANGALQGGEIIAGKQYEVAYNSTTGTAVLVGQSGGALQIAPAIQSQHAITAGQAAGVVGSVRNLAMSVTAASASATLTADEIIVETALGGVRYCLPSFSKTINLATTGAGGMDAGSAPISGYVALYAIYNPTTEVSALLATNTTSATAPNICNGAVPAGYTASALVSVWPTNGSGQFAVGSQIDRAISIIFTQVLNTSVTQSSATSLSIAGTVPPNARSISGSLIAGSTSTSSVALEVSGSSSRIGEQGISSVTTSISAAYSRILIPTQQTLYYLATSTAGTPGFTIFISGYEF